MKILMGPLNVNCFTEYTLRGFSDHDVLTFSDREADVLYRSPRASFNDVLARLPAGWKPDLVIFWFPEYQCLVPGIVDCPYPTVLAVSDWHCNFEPVADICDMFDAVVTDRAGTRLLAGRTSVPVIYTPLAGFDPLVHRRLPDCEPEVDIGIVADLCTSLHDDRSRVLARAAALNGRFRVRFFTNLLGEDYVRCVNGTRITLNHTLRGEMSMRCYEAPACGSLLFCESSNQEVRDYFTDGVHCVLYTDENLESQLVHYLQNEPERRRVAEAGHARVQEFSYRNHMNALLAKVRDLDPGARPFRKRPAAWRQRAISAQAYGSCEDVVTHRALHHARRAHSLAPHDSEVLNMLGCASAQAADKESDCGRREALRDGAEEAFEQAAGLGVMPLLNHAQLLLRRGRTPAATRLLEQAVSGEEGFQYGSFYPHPYDRFLFEWERSRETRSDLVAWKVHVLLADLCPAQAADHLRQAVKHRPDIGATWYRLAANLDPASPEYILALVAAIARDPILMDARYDLIRARWPHARRDAMLLAAQTASVLTAFPYDEDDVQRLATLMDTLTRPGA